MAMALSIAKSTPQAQLKTKTQRLLDFASRQLFAKDFGVSSPVFSDSGIVSYLTDLDRSKMSIQ